MMDDEDHDGDTVIADDLSVDGNTNSNMNEITSAEAAELRYNKQRYRSWMLMLVISTFLCSVLIASVKFFAPGRFYNEGGTSTTYDIYGSGDNGLGNAVNQRRLEETLDYLVTREASDIITLLPNNTNSPQYMAARWIATIDQHRLDIPKADGTTSKDEYPFLQRYSLAVLFLSTGGLNWMFRLNFLRGTHECAWFEPFGTDDRYPMGIWCDKNPGTLTERDRDDNLWESSIVTDVHLLPSNGGVGTLPSELRHLRYLKTLRIYNQQFISGEIPSEYGFFQNLQVLDLEGNQLEGEIPSSFNNLNNLTMMNLRHNRLSGISAEAINQMDNLLAIALDSNRIEGKLPEFNLPNLLGLTLSDNALTGEISNSMSGLSSLQMLALDHNKLTGNLDILQDMTHLTHVYLDNNNWDHEINDLFFAGHENITHLDISNCSIRGIVPGHLFDRPKLEILDLSRNLLEGDLQPAISNTNDTTTKLRYLSLHSNNITGPIPQGISKLKSLKHLDLSYNKMDGPINEELGALTGLEYLFLGNNDFSQGKIPDEIRNLTNLEELSLKSNNLNGEIPDWIGELVGLKLLDLGENFLNGTLPDSMGDLTKLWILMLNTNNLRGDIPSSFSQLEDLETLLIDGNSFEGTTAPVCESRGWDRITHFVSDCASNSSTYSDAASGSIGGWSDPVIVSEIECECCTLCCSDEDVTCNDDEWIAHHEGAWQLGYERVYWDFEENGIISEVTDAVDTLAQAWGLP